MYDCICIYYIIYIYIYIYIYIGLHILSKPAYIKPIVLFDAEGSLNVLLRMPTQTLCGIRVFDVCAVLSDLVIRSEAN